MVIRILKGIHFLLSYACNYECDHCFLYCSPNSQGTFTFDQISRVLDEAGKIDSVEWIFFEGGEPFLYYPILVEGIRLARERGFKTGIVTNSYFATSVEDAEIWLKPFKELGLDELSISDDTFHYGNEARNLAKKAKQAALNLGIPMSSICIEEPRVEMQVEKDQEKGTPVIGGGAMFRGRAVDKLIEGLPRRDWRELTSCPYEDLKGLGRVHVDSFGNVHLCQGLVIGNLWETPLSKLIENYDVKQHPICDPLLRGGPAKLAEEQRIDHEIAYVDECHLCYIVRKELIARYPQFLGPNQVYGINE